MRKRTSLFGILLVVLVTTGCHKPSPEVVVPATETELSVSSTPFDTPTSVPPSETPNILLVEAPAPETVALDFVADICSANWSSNAYQLPCPGHLDDTDGGYIEAADHTILEGMVSVEAPLLIGLPGKGYPAGVGLFGRYPPFTVYPGDMFHTTIACQGDADCDLEFSLEYYDAQGTYHGSAFRFYHQFGEGPVVITADLNSLAGQTVDFLLTLRAQEELADQWGVWIQPYIARDPDAKPLPTQEILPTATVDPEDQTPGVISGMVDMASAPPYLKSSYGESNSSSPVAVVFFNLSDGTYWWIHTSLTGHPYFQMTVTPGEYQVVAYAHGVGDVPYVEGGYTGQNPSCGKNLKTITVPPNGSVENIVIADWNWTCGGTAYRPPKPGGVPLP
jgi:hypothetical protein